MCCVQPEKLGDFENKINAQEHKLKKKTRLAGYRFPAKLCNGLCKLAPKQGERKSTLNLEYIDQ
jgi:hypothetical protein